MWKWVSVFKDSVLPLIVSNCFGKYADYLLLQYSNFYFHVFFFQSTT